MLVLDTHVWLWWIANDERLRSTWRDAIETDVIVGVSAISLFEVAWLAEHNRIELGCSLGWWFEQALDASDIRLLPISPSIAESAAALPEHHRDPQDRIIIATALEHQAQLLSADTKFKLYQELRDLLVL